jgi:hypothetical protein
MANCNEYIFKTFSLSLHGQVLSIYEAGDQLGQACVPLFDRSPELGERREIRLATGCDTVSSFDLLTRGCSQPSPGLEVAALPRARILPANLTI